MGVGGLDESFTFRRPCKWRNIDKTANVATWLSLREWHVSKCVDKATELKRTTPLALQVSVLHQQQQLSLTTHWRKHVLRTREPLHLASQRTLRLCSSSAEKQEASEATSWFSKRNTSTKFHNYLFRTKTKRQAFLVHADRPKHTKQFAIEVINHLPAFRRRSRLFFLPEVGSFAAILLPK